MPETLVLKNRQSDDAAPLPGDIEVGELAINLVNGVLYSKDEADEVFPLNESPFPPPFQQNLINGEAGGVLQNISGMSAGDAIVASGWHEPDPDFATLSFRRFFNFNSPASVDSIDVFQGDNGEMRLTVRFGSVNVCQCTTVDPLPTEFFHWLFAIDTTNAPVIVINGVVQALEGTVAPAHANWNSWNSNALFAHNLAATNILNAPQMADWWFDRFWMDLTDPDNVKKFYDNGPVDLGVNGEIPTGIPPVIFLGSDLVAADWNAGGALGDYAGVWVKTGGAFTDV